MQGEGCRVTSASDHTHRVLMNYIRENIFGATAVHTIGCNTGALAHAGIVPSTEAIYFSHGVEQFANRRNVNPIVHSIDNWPNNSKLYVAIFGPRTTPRLGTFHFLKRMTSTLRKGHSLFGEVTAKISKAIFYDLPDDLKKVELELKNGTLGGKEMSVAEIIKLKKENSIWKNWRCYIRNPTFSVAPIQSTLQEIYDEYDTPYDRNASELPIFTLDSKLAFENCIEKTEGVVDVVGIDTLFERIPPSRNAVCRLPKWINNRGTESKLEKAHHSLAHYGNGGMTNGLADSLNFAGVSLYNLSIWYRHQLQMMDGEERAKNQLHTNHLFTILIIFVLLY